MHYRHFLVPMVGLAFAGAAAAQTPTSSPSYPQSSPTQTPINPPSTPSSGMAMQDGQRREGPEMTFVKAHLDTVLQGVSLSYSQYRRIDSTAMSQLAMSGLGGRGMGMGRDGMRDNQNCQPSSSSTGSNNMPGSTGTGTTPCTPNQSGSGNGYPSSSSGSTGSGYPSSSGTPNDTSRSPRWDNRDSSRAGRDSSRAGRDGMGRDGMGRDGMRRDGMGRDSLDSNARQRLMPILDQLDTAIRPILNTAQQRTFDRNLSSWRRTHSTSTN
jgi:hypothetical protein